MKPFQLRAQVSAYVYAMLLTAAACLLAAGLLYISLCADGMLRPSGGLLSPEAERFFAWLDTLPF